MSALRQELSQPDGYSDLVHETHRHATPNEREHEALTRQLIRTVSVRYLGQPYSGPMLSSSVDTYRILSGMAVAMVDSDRRTKLKLDTVQEMTEDRRVVHDVAGFAKAVIEAYESKLFAAGAAQLGGAR